MAREAVIFIEIRTKAELAAIKKAGVEIRKLGGSQEKQAKAQKKANEAAKKANDTNKNLKDSLRGLAASIAVVDGPLGGIASRFNAFGTVLGRVNKRLIAVTAGFIALSAVARIGVKAFGEVEKLTFRLNAALETTGRLGETSLDKFVQAAEKLGKETLTSKEAALEALAALTAFQGIPTSKLIQILELSQDLSVVLGGDLRQNAIFLGRVFSDLERASEFLRRKGLQLTKQQVEAILVLLEQGKQIEAITLFQEKLSSIQGIAKKEAEGLAGTFDTLGEIVRITTANFVKYSGIVFVLTGFLKGITVAFESVNAIILLVVDIVNLAIDTFLIWIPLIIALGIKHIPILTRSLIALSATPILAFLPGASKLTIAFGAAATGSAVKALTLRAAILAIGVAAIATAKKLFLLVLTSPFLPIVAGIAIATAGLIAFNRELKGIGDVFNALRVTTAVVMAAIGTSIAQGVANLKTFKNVILIGLDKVPLITKLIDREAVLKNQKEVVDALNKKILENAEDLQTKINKLAGIEDLDPGKRRAEANAKLLEQLRKQNKSLNEQQNINEKLIFGGVKLASIAKLMAQRIGVIDKATLELLDTNIKLLKTIEEQKRILGIQAELEGIEAQIRANRLIIEGKEKSIAIANILAKITNETSDEEAARLIGLADAVKELEAQEKIMGKQEKRIKTKVKEEATFLSSLKEQTKALEDQVLINALLSSGAETNADIAALIIKFKKEIIDLTEEELGLINKIRIAGAQLEKEARVQKIRNENKALDEQLIKLGLIAQGVDPKIAALKAQVGGELDPGKETELRDKLRRERDLLRIIDIQTQNTNLREQVDINNILLSGSENSATIAALIVQKQRETNPVLREQIQNTIDLTIETEKQLQTIQRNKAEWDSVNAAFKDTFKGIITGTDTVGDAIQKLTDKLTDLAFEAVFADLNLQNLFGGGGGGGGGGFFDIFAGLFKEGGLVGKPVGSTLVPASAFSNAPHFSHGGTTGGIPAILHRNEAVIPLSRNRKIPVDMNGAQQAPTIIFNITTPDAESFQSSEGQILNRASRVLQRSSTRNG